MFDTSPRSLRFVHLGVAVSLLVAAATGVGLARAAAATGTETASSFVPIVPCRLVDTRAGTDFVGTRSAPIAAGETVTFAVWGAKGNCTIPSTATGVATNVTAVNPTQASYVTVYPTDAVTRPTASNLNVTAGAPPTPNQVTVGLSATGSISAYNNAGSLDIVIDIVGYYEPSVGGGTGPSGPVGPVGLVGPVGPAGATGANGPVGAACPAGGCAVVFSGAATVPTSGTASTLDNFACRSIPINTGAELDLALPVGAKITAISVLYNDNNAGNLAFDLYSVTVPGNSKVNPTGVSLQSVNGSLIGNLFFTTTPPPVGVGGVPYIFAVANGAAGIWCGAIVTYMF